MWCCGSCTSWSSQVQRSCSEEVRFWNGYMYVVIVGMTHASRTYGYLHKSCVSVHTKVCLHACCGIYLSNTGTHVCYSFLGCVHMYVRICICLPWTWLLMHACVIDKSIFMWIRRMPMWLHPTRRGGTSERVYYQRTYAHSHNSIHSYIHTYIHTYEYVMHTP
jgi:hypothetical protein